VHTRRGGVRERNQLARRVRRGEPERSVRALAVVVVNVCVEHPLELPFANDEQPVQALLTDRAHPALSVSVGVGRLDRCLDHPDTVGPEDLIERSGYLVSRSCSRKRTGL
jgi:hypothetical protein